MSWSAEQHRLLAAMGLQPMRERGSEPEQVVRVQVQETVQAFAVSAPSTRSSAPRAFPGDAPARNNARPPAGKPAALLDALRRAAGGCDISDLVADLERLRREPALKRALWPRLRALRRH